MSYSRCLSSQKCDLGNSVEWPQKPDITMSSGSFERQCDKLGNGKCSPNSEREKRDTVQWVLRHPATSANARDLVILGSSIVLSHSYFIRLYLEHATTNCGLHVRSLVANVILKGIRS